MPGDVNGDGSIGIADITVLIDYLLGVEAANFVLLNADADGNGKIDIADVTRIIDMILGKR